MSVFKDIARRLLCDAVGNVLPIAAVGLLVSAAIVGGGIDMSRAYRAQNRLQSACDAAVLAGRKEVSTNGFDTAAQTQANNYFQTNFDETSQEARNTQFTATSDDNGNTVKGTASTEVDAAVMKVFGFKTFNLAVNCTASMGVGNSDVVMVLDTTGSMGSTLSGTYETRIEALRTAMKNFYTTLDTATQGTNARVRYGFVPYSTTVNVGHLLYDLNPDYLVDSYAIQSRQPVFVSWSDPEYTSDSGTTSTSNGSWHYYSYSYYYSSSSCNSAKPSDTAWQDYGSPSTSTSTTTDGDGQQVTTTTTSQQQRMTEYSCYDYYGHYYVIYRYDYRSQYSSTIGTSSPTYTSTPTGTFDHFDYKQVTYDTSSYKAFSPVTTYTGDGGSAVSSTWDGCIEERKTVAEPSFSYSSLLGMTPGGAYDLDLDSAPDSGNDATKWAPMWPEVAYCRQTSDSSSCSSYRFTTATTSQYGGKAKSYCPHKAQELTEMTQSDFDAYADALSPEGNTYLDIGMIWGGRLSSPDGIFSSNVNSAPANGGKVSRHIIFMTDGYMEPNYTIQEAYGIEYFDRRVTDDGYTDDADRHSSRFLAICKAIKAKGIRIWVIAFTSSLSSDLQTCASDNSSFTASSADDLNSAFQEIAREVGELRITQ